MSSLKKRVARFRQRGGNEYDTSLMAAGEHRPIDSGAITNWYLTRARARPCCFGCRSGFDKATPAAFLTATPIHDRTTIAVAAMCAACWLNKSPEQIEADALGVLRRQLCPTGRWMEAGHDQS